MQKKTFLIDQDDLDRLARSAHQLINSTTNYDGRRAIAIEIENIVAKSLRRPQKA